MMNKPLNLPTFGDPRNSTASGGFEYSVPTATTATEYSDFYKMREGQHSNALVEIGTKAKYGVLDLKQTARINYKNYVLFIENNVGDVSTTALKLLDALIITATEQGKPATDRLIELPLSKYKAMRGLADDKEARKQVKQDLKALEAMTLEYSGKHQLKDNYLRLKIGAGKSGIVNSVIIFEFRPEYFSEAITQHQYMFYPREALKLNDKYNPNSFYFLRKVSSHKRMNIGKPSEDIIGVKTLVNTSPDLRNKLKNKSTRFTQQILTPFERDMDTITAFKWEYVGESNKQAEAPDNLQEFMGLNVRVVWHNYPATPEIKRLAQTKRQKTKYKKTKGTKR